MRQIFSNKSRFIAIFAIVLIGVGFFAGILATGDDMRLGADRYYDEYGLMDFRLISTYGFSDRDVAALKDMGGIECIPLIIHDFVVDIDGSEDRMPCVFLQRGERRQYSVSCRREAAGK